MNTVQFSIGSYQREDRRIYVGEQGTERRDAHKSSQSRHHKMDWEVISKELRNWLYVKGPTHLSPIVKHYKVLAGRKECQITRVSLRLDHTVLPVLRQAQR